jgi:hypothetical protein
MRELSFLRSGLILTLAACSRAVSSPSASADAAASSAPIAASSPPSASSSRPHPPASASAPETPPPPPLPSVRYERYTNTRYAFSLDAPTFMKPSPPPTNSDGQEWTWGPWITLTAWGMHNMASDTGVEVCTHNAEGRAGISGRRANKSTCWLTGTEGRTIFWEKTIVSPSFLFGLSFRYDARLKEAMDSVVTHVNASFEYWKCAAGSFEACDRCYKKCTSNAECKGAHETCKEITCSDALGTQTFGRGCYDPEEEFSLPVGAFVFREDDAGDE